MKIDPKHDYKKPLYAVGVAALVGSTAVFGTGCGPAIMGGMTTTEYNEPQLGGDTQVAEKIGGDTQVVEQLAGEAQVEFTEPVIEGDMFIDEDYYDDDETSDDSVCEAIVNVIDEED